MEFLRQLPDRGARDTLDEARVGVRRRSGWLDRRATNVFDKEWDVLLVLDACRADLLESVSDEYHFLPSEVGTIWSVGATSPMWLENTFGPLTADELGNVGYLTGNPWSGRLDLGFDSLAVFDELWRTTWNEEKGYQPPRPLTDRAISVLRDRDDIDRLVVHYMQPHIPFVSDPGLTRKMGVTETYPDEKTVWEKVRDGEVDRDRVWKAYQDNLRFVLEEVELLRENLDADTLAVSADHGNAMGELGQAGHGSGTLVRAVCEVPWVELDCTDGKGYDPTQSDVRNAAATSEETGEDIVNDRLSALGYTEQE